MRTKLLLVLLLTIFMVNLINGYRRYRYYRYRRNRINYLNSRRYSRYNMQHVQIKKTDIKRSFYCKAALPSPHNQCTKVTCQKQPGQLTVYLQKNTKEACLYQGKCYKESRSVIPTDEGCKMVYCSKTTFTSRVYSTLMYCLYDGMCYPGSKPFPGKDGKMCKCRINYMTRKLIPHCT